jgi:translation elongation factor EF-4
MIPVRIKIKTVSERLMYAEFQMGQYDEPVPSADRQSTVCTKMDNLVKAERVDALSSIIHRSTSDRRGRAQVNAWRRKSTSTSSKLPFRPSLVPR